jgi:hypothetical protein
MIYYLTPFCSQKRLGHIHNQYCALVPNDDDYICILDPDVMMLHPHQMKWIEDIVLSEEWQKYDVLGCMTNRVGIDQQVSRSVSVTWERIGSKIVEKEFLEHKETMFDLYDVKKHTIYADIIHDKNKFIIEEAEVVAGFLMIFKKSIWNQIKFEESIQFDMKFCNAVKQSGGKIGIMKGIYVFHNYRMGKDNIKDKTHLLNRNQ